MGLPACLTTQTAIDRHARIGIRTRTLRFIQPTPQENFTHAVHGYSNSNRAIRVDLPHVAMYFVATRDHSGYVEIWARGINYGNALRAGVFPSPLAAAFRLIL